MSLEKLEHDVAVKLAVVDKSLTKVEDYRKQLQENARKVTEDIHEAVDRQVGALRGRERQLVRQVEVVTAHQNCLLSTQQAGLLHSQGALTVTKNLLQRCTSADVNTLSKIKMDDMACTRNIKPVNLVSVQLNETALTSAIGAFGSVQLPETITHHPSPVIPAKVEEYEDEDHDVLHKSVAGAASGPDSPVRVTVQFPRLNQQNWLIGNKDGHPFGPSAKVPKRRDSKCTVTSWLSSLQISGMQDEEENALTPSSIGSFDLMSNCGSTPALTSESSSIEIVPSHFDSEKEECSPMGSLCEIENLPACLEDKSRWLSPKHKPLQKSAVHQIQVADVCQANEPCADFSECRCMGSCAESALQKAKQPTFYQTKVSRKRPISEVYGSNPILSHMADILSSDNSEWLARNSSSYSHPQNLSKKAMYEAPGEKWITSPKSSSGNAPKASRIMLSVHSNVWLLHKLKAEKTKGKEEKEEENKESSTRKENRCELSEMFKDFGLERNSPERCEDKQSKFSVSYLFSGMSDESSYTSHVDNKTLEDRKSEDLTIDRKPWLYCHSSIDANSRHNLTSSLSSPSFPSSMLGVTPGELDNWLLKRL